MNAKKSPSLPVLHRIFPFVLQLLTWPFAYLIFVSFGHFKIEGRKNLKGISQAIFAANHASELDPIVVTAALNPVGRFAPLFYVAAPVAEFKNNKNVGWRSYVYGTAFFHAWGAHQIVRGTHDYRVSLAKHLTILTGGGSICIFPEGGTTKTGDLGTPRGGVMFLAKESGVPIIPTAISGTYKAGRSFWRRKRKVIVSFGEPVYPSEVMDDPTQHQLEAQKLFTRIFTMLERHKTTGYHIPTLTRLMYRFVRNIGSPIVRTIWVKRVVGRENIPKKGPVLIAANHQSYFDFISIIAIAPRNVYFLAAEKFFKHAFSRFIMHITGQVEVDRNNKENRKRLDKIVYDLLQEGNAIGIFPEGTRSASNEHMLKGYMGIIRFAFATGTPIVPIGIRGAYEVMSRFDEYPKFKKNIELNIGKPIHFPNPLTSEPSDEHMQQQLKQLMYTLAKLSGKQEAE